MLDLRISVHRQLDRTLMTVAGELDLATGPELQARLREQETVDRELVIDLSRLSFVDAAGLRMLVCARRVAAERGQRISVARTSPSLERLLALTGARPELGLPEPA